MRALFILSLALMAVALPLSGAGAAPQILGVIASNGVVPLHCADGACTAELSTFCLQQDRRVPSAGTEYDAVSGNGVTLVVTTADGDTRRLDALDYVQFVSVRNYTAVMVSIPAKELAVLEAVSAAVEIGEGVALVPEAVAGDQRPQTDADVAIAVGALRTAGTWFVDRSAAATTARALNRIVNVLSPDAHASVTPRDSLWQDTVVRYENDLDTPGLSRAARVYESCHANAMRDTDAGLRWCLQLRHDALIIDLNSDYWASLRTGS